MTVFTVLANMKKCYHKRQLYNSLVKIDQSKNGSVTTVGNNFLSIISIIFPGEQRSLSFVVGILLIITGFFLWPKRRPSTNKNSSSDKYTSNAIGQDDSSREHTMCQSHLWSSALDHLKSNRAQRLNASHYKAPPELPSITI